jgi:hypothetical protein
MKRFLPRRSTALVLAAGFALAPTICEAQRPDHAIAPLSPLDQARGLIQQGAPSQAIAVLRPLRAAGCHAVAYYLTGVAYSRLDAHVQTARTILKALDCRPALNATLTQGADRLLRWAAYREARGPSRAFTGGTLSLSDERPPDPFTQRSERQEWEALFARIQARNPGIEREAIAKAARRGPHETADCLLGGDPQTCGEALTVPKVSLGD